MTFTAKHANHAKWPQKCAEAAKHLPLRLERGLEPLGERRKEFATGEDPVWADRVGASESLGPGEVSILRLQPPVSSNEYPVFSLQPLAFCILPFMLRPLKSAIGDLKSSPAWSDPLGWGGQIGTGIMIHGLLSIVSTDPCARLGQPQPKLVGQRKQSLHSPHDFPILLDVFHPERGE